MSETERERPSATLELLALLAATEGVVELRKRGGPAARPTAAGCEDCLETMARRAAERAGHPLA
ncbi:MULTISPECIES: hypothetical protein [unclassified Streptomyces]|uniref:hypothetical protein n=1 Tax=unclassified Streptomyces TaxID=2593676 RepID=UPI002E365C7B|nr:MULTISPECIES: hypothetical protein [unclassified Streptomyces]WUC63700.1 hypothetical protein OG861_05375 [Streptomyces sp. NBC_00539]